MKVPKKILRTAIAKSQMESWKSLCEDIDKNDWGQGYKIAVRRVKETGPIREKSWT